MEIIPIRTSKEKLSTIEIVDGQLIFVTDDKKLYLDKDTKRIELNKDSLNTWAEGLEAKAYGNKVLATGDYSLAFGDQVAATGEGAQAFGKGTITYDTNTDGTHTNIAGKGLASGKYSFVANSSSVASGNAAAAFTGATASGDNSFAIGASGVASAGNSISLGGTASGQNAIAISPSATAAGANSVAILAGAQALGGNCLAIGGGAAAGENGNNSTCIAIGQGSKATNGGVAIGTGVTAKGGMVFGRGCASSASEPVIGNGISLPDTVTSAIMFGTGFSCSDMTNNSIGIGYGHIIKGKGSALGTGLKTTKDNEFAIGNYNISSDDTVFSIGGGTSSAAKNLLKIDDKDNIIGKNFIGEKFLNIWAASTQYILNEVVIKDNNIYKCTEAHTSTETFDNSKWKLLLAVAAGINFNELSTMLTSGSLSGLAITPNEEKQNFDIAVTGIPTISIDAEGYWLINGDRGDNPTKAKGEKGDNGIPPHIDESTKHWFVGESDTGVNATAGIDDSSITSTDVTWSANKINSVIGNINTILASITGEVI